MAAHEAESAEKPVREQLKKTSLQANTEMIAASDVASTAVSSNGAEPSVLSRKRSFEDIDQDPQINSNHTSKSHNRKRSRDSTAEDDEATAHKKRSSEEIKRETEPVNTTNGVSSARATTPETAEKDVSENNLVSPASKRSRLQEQEPAPPAKLGPGSGFANTSITSPFGAVSPNKAAAENQQQTSASAFAASGFSALAQSSTSGFGAVGKSTGGFGSSSGGFGSGTSAKTTLKDDPASDTKDSESGTSAFGGALGAKSAFSGATTNGFGSGTGPGFGGGLKGFGSGSGFASLNAGAKLTSFASSKPDSTLSQPKPAKPFGGTATADEDDADDAEPDGSGIRSPLSVGTDEEQKDERFYEQEAETGEEDEKVIFSSRAKLYLYTTTEGGKKEWRERGLGVLKLNQRKAADAEEDATDNAEASEPQARFLMRADGSHRVVLNTPIKKEIKVGKAGGGAPTNGSLLFMGTINGQAKLELLQLKMKQQQALELYDRVLAIQGESEA